MVPTSSHTISNEIGTNRCRPTSITKNRKEQTTWLVHRVYHNIQKHIKTGTWNNIKQTFWSTSWHPHRMRCFNYKIRSCTRTTEGWVAVAYASRFLNSLEEKFSVNELELLGVAWAIEQFKYFLYGKIFNAITDHQALISALNASEWSKASQSQLTRWIDRLIPFHFDIKHLAGCKSWLIDYMSRKPTGLAIPLSEYDEEFVVASIRTFINNLDMIDNVILNNLAIRKKHRMSWSKSARNS